MRVTTAQLHHLANLYGIKTSYLDMDDQVQAASAESLLAVLKAMGAAVSNMEDVPAAIRQKHQEHWRQVLEPVIVTWGDEIFTVNLRLPARLVESRIEASLILENGEKRDLVWRAEESSIIDSITVEGKSYVTLRLYLPEKLPEGYHRLALELAGHKYESLIISAPMRAYAPAERSKIWGAFLPLYALHSKRSWGAGDFADMEDFMKWVYQMGGRLIGTLPLLPSFFDRQFGPGPYMPASRLFWNEFYLDIERIPELAGCTEAQALMNSADFKKEISASRSGHMVDYNRQSALKRQVIEILAEQFFREKPARFSEFQRYVKDNPRLEDYASFRAAGEKHGVCWHDWPKRLRDGDLKKGDYTEKAKRYHLYAQWLTQEQVRGLAGKAEERDLYLYLDMPVGVHPYAYDVWREKESFVFGVNGGAPPDPVFTSGQNWCFPPLHPEKIRQQGYRYFIDSLRHQLQFATMLRVDHIMNFHRLFWIPEGMENREGLYVSYRAEELYAILVLESCRRKAVIIGEDLGMVPPEVRPMMDRHGIYRMYVGQYQLIAENQLGKVPAHSVASLNTHDMFPFAAFWEEIDITERQKIKLIDAARAQKELEERRNVKRALISILQYKGLYNEVSPDTEAMLKAILDLLAAGPSFGLLVNLEDLWLEVHPQNVPGTMRQQNWSRKARYSMEEFVKSPQVLSILCGIEKSRQSSSVSL